jgi:hypothetical protein
MFGRSTWSNPGARHVAAGDAPTRTGATMDYDERPSTSWDWARVGRSFRELEKSGTLVFE